MFVVTHWTAEDDAALHNEMERLSLPPRPSADQIWTPEDTEAFRRELRRQRASMSRGSAGIGLSLQGIYNAKAGEAERLDGSPGNTPA